MNFSQDTQSVMPTIWLFQENVSVTTGAYHNGSNTGFDYANSELNLPMKIIIGFFMLFMIFIGFLGNSVVCLIVIQKPAMRSAINLLLANMAVSDILTSITSMIFSFLALFWSDSILNNVTCRLFSFLQELFLTVATVMLLTISVDRYLIIVHKRDKLVSKNARLLIIFVWIFAATVTFPATVGWGQYKYMSSTPQCVLGDHGVLADEVFVILKVLISFFIPVLVMTFSFCQILNVFRKNRHRVHNQNDMEFTISVISSRGKLGLPVLRRSLRVSVDMGFKTRAFKTILILFIAYFLCWAPYVFNTLMSITLGDYNRTRNVLFLWTGFTNSMINPIIYFIRIRKFREACRSLTPDNISLTHGIFSFTKRRINPGQTYQITEPSSS